MSTNKPDMFGKHHKIINHIHSNLINILSSQFDYKKEDLTMSILQSSIFEYIKNKHDENYSYYIFEVDYKRESQVTFFKDSILVLSVNNHYSHIINEETINNFFIQELIEKWSLLKKVEIKYIEKRNILKVNKNDTIQTIHYFNKSEQLFKIIYFYNVWCDILGRIV